MIIVDDIRKINDEKDGYSSIGIGTYVPTSDVESKKKKISEIEKEKNEENGDE